MLSYRVVLYGAFVARWMPIQWIPNTTTGERRPSFRFHAFSALCRYPTTSMRTIIISPTPKVLRCPCIVGIVTSVRSFRASKVCIRRWKSGHFVTGTRIIETVSPPTSHIHCFTWSVQILFGLELLLCCYENCTGIKLSLSFRRHGHGRPPFEFQTKQKLVRAPLS